MEEKKQRFQPGNHTQHVHATDIFDLRKHVATLAIRFGTIAQQKNLFLAIDITPCTPRFFQGDAAAFDQVFSGLISHSLQSISHGGLTITIDCFGPNSSGFSKIHLEVTDTSMNNSSGKIILLSETRPQVDNSFYTLGEVKKIARSQGGNLHVYPTNGWGTRYLATLCYKEMTLHPSEIRSDSTVETTRHSMADQHYSRA
jgi:signal transduction histidine kinase